MENCTECDVPLQCGFSIMPLRHFEDFIQNQSAFRCVTLRFVLSLLEFRLCPV